MQMLEAPAAFHQLDGQPVEQLRMRRRFALRAQVFTGADDPGTEISLPDPVDNRSSRRRRLTVDHPAGERQAVYRLVGRQRVKERGRGGSHRLARLEKISTLE